MKVHAVALRSGRDPAANAALAVAAVRAAAADGADLVVLPEYAAAFDPRGVGADLAEPLDAGFVAALQLVAEQTGVAVLAGTTVADGDRAANVVVAVDGAGHLAGTYRKVHLYDAFGHRESDRLVAGDPGHPPLVVQVADLAVGVLTCYDLRFPEAARRLVDAGADVIAVPAAWAAGPSKADHWETLLRARAIESTSYVVGATQQGPGVTGDALVLGPDGAELARACATADGEPAAAVAEIRADEVAAVRARNPSLANRRYAVVPLPPGSPAAGSPEPGSPAPGSLSQGTPGAGTEVGGPAPRRVWDVVLSAGLGLVAVLGLVLVLAAGPATSAFEALLVGGPGPVPDGAATDYLVFVHRVLGAVLVGWAVLLGGLTRALRRRERRAWLMTSASLVTWYALDTTVSLASGFGANAALNTALGLVLAVPLAGMYPELAPGRAPRRRRAARGAPGPRAEWAGQRRA